MSRSTLTLYELDRPRLKELAAELERILRDDDREALVELLELKGALTSNVEASERAVDLFLLPESHPDAAPLFASLRRVAKKRALTAVMTSASPALEGRLRGYEPLRDDARLAKLVDKLVQPKRLPWFLRRPNATCGWLDGEEAATLARGMGALRAALTPELQELAEGLDQLTADAVLHDGL